MELVQTGKVTAALDNEVIMRYIAHSYFLTGLQFNSKVNFGEDALPDKLHIVVPADKPQLRSLIDKAIAAIGESQLEYLSNKWLVPDQDIDVSDSNVVPSDTLIKIASDAGIHGQLVETQFAGEPYLAYAAPLGDGNSPLFMGILSSRKTLEAPFIKQITLEVTAARPVTFTVRLLVTF